MLCHVTRYTLSKTIEGLIDDIKLTLSSAGPPMRGLGYQETAEESNQRWGRSGVKDYFFVCHRTELDIDPARGYAEKQNCGRIHYSPP